MYNPGVIFKRIVLHLPGPGKEISPRNISCLGVFLFLNPPPAGHVDIGEHIVYFLIPFIIVSNATSPGALGKATGREKVKLNKLPPFYFLISK